MALQMTDSFENLYQTASSSDINQSQLQVAAVSEWTSAGFSSLSFRLTHPDTQ